MTYQSSSIIEASDPTNDDFNELVALVNEVYGDSHSGELTLPAGSFGYGQTPEISTVSAGDIITAAQWTELFSALAACANHQGASVGSVPGSVTTGDIVDAIDGVGGTKELIDTIRAGRLTVDPSESTTSFNGTKLTDTRATAWTVSATHVFTVTFPTRNDARYFFNAGGEIRWSASYTPGASNESGEETAWQQSLNDIGTLVFSYNTTTADSGSTSSIGYYDLNETTPETLLVKTIGTPGVGYYSTESVTVEAKYTDASANIIEFTVFFATDPGTAPNDGVLSDRVLDGTLSSYVDQKVSVNSIVTGEPVYATTTSLVSGS